jgi:photosystem II stability/assembly factor-like uncharacterized protein
MLLKTLLRRFIYFVSAILLIAFLFLNSGAALAHTPHDDVTQLELSPNYDRDRTLFIIVRGNLLKSQDGGESWRRLEKGLDNQNSLYRIPSSLAISQSSPNILYLAAPDDGIYGSSNAGESWFKINRGLDTRDISFLSVAPNSAEFVLAASREKGLYRTQNGGKTWQKIIGDKKITAMAYLPGAAGDFQIVIGDDKGEFYLSQDSGNTWKERYKFNGSGRIRKIVVSPNFPNDKTILIGTRKAGIFKSVDGGKSWQEANQGILDKSITSIAFSPNYSKDSTVFAASFTEGGFRSNDGGKTWKKYSEGLARNPQADEYKLPHFTNIRISPQFSQNKTIFLSAFSGLFESTDGGFHWREMVTLPAEILTGIGLSPTYQKDATAAIGTYIGGGFITKDGGMTWQPLLEKTKNLAPEISSRLYAVIFSPNYPEDNTIFATTWQHFLRSGDGGKTWDAVPLTKRKFWIFKGALSQKPVAAISPNFAKDKTIYLGTEQGDIFRSTDGGKSLSNITNVPLDINSLAISANFSEDKTLYLGSSDGAYESVDGGNNWQPVNRGLPQLKGQPTAIVISPDFSRDKTLFAGTAAGLFKTTDGADNWTQVTENSKIESKYIEALAVSPNYAQNRTLIVSVRGEGLFKTIDGGNSFTAIGKNLIDNNYLLSHMRDFPAAANPIIFSPTYATDRTIYGFSGTKLFKSEDGGENWQIIATPANLPTPKDTTYYFTPAMTAETQPQKKAPLLTFLISPIGRFAAASLVGLFSYVLAGYFNLDKRLNRSKQMTKLGSAVAGFIVAFFVCWGLTIFL